MCCVKSTYTILPRQNYLVSHPLKFPPQYTLVCLPIRIHNKTLLKNKNKNQICTNCTSKTTTYAILPFVILTQIHLLSTIPAPQPQSKESISHKRWEIVRNSSNKFMQHQPYMRLPSTSSSVKGNSAILWASWPWSSPTFLHRLRHFHWFSGAKSFRLTEFHIYPVSSREGASAGDGSCFGDRKIGIHRKKLLGDGWVVTVIVCNWKAEYFTTFSLQCSASTPVTVFFFQSIFEDHSRGTWIWNISHSPAFIIIQRRATFRFIVLPLMGRVIQIPHSWRMTCVTFLRQTYS